MALSLDIEAESERLDSEKPYLELIDGVEVPKSMPMTRHSMLQVECSMILRQWAGERGIVGTELRAWLNVAPVRPTSLVPDVAFFSFERLRALSPQEQQRPPISPDIVIEIRSPKDRERNIARKIELYLAHGASLVLDILPERREIVAHDLVARRVFHTGDRFAHDAAPGLVFEIDDFFARGEIG